MKGNQDYATKDIDRNKRQGLVFNFATPQPHIAGSAVSSSFIHTHPADMSGFEIENQLC